MKKHLEDIHDPLFTPLTADDLRPNVAVAAETQHISILETNNPNPDETFDFG